MLVIRFYLLLLIVLIDVGYFVSEPFGVRFFRMIRPEFVKSQNKPLSSDAFSAFGRLDSEIHNQEVEDATQQLFQRISKISKTLTANESTHVTSILERLHEQGIFHFVFDSNEISLT